MGCNYSRPGDDVVKKFKARKCFMKQAVSSRQAFSAAHTAYLQALRNTGSALRQFAEGEAKDTTSLATSRSQLELPPPPPPHLLSSPPFKYSLKIADTEPSSISSSRLAKDVNDGSWSPGSSASEKETDTPPPPSPQKSSTWDIFNPFRPSSPPFNLQPESQRRRKERGGAAQGLHRGRGNYSAYEAEEDKMQNSLVVIPRLEDDFEGYTSNSALAKWEQSSRDFATMVRNGTGRERDLLDMVKDLDSRFLQASASGSAVSKVLETKKGNFLSANEVADARKLSNSNMFSPRRWNWSRSPADHDLSSVADSELMGSHALTLERLRVWEKKLFREVKAAESLRSEYLKKCNLLRQQEAKGEDANVADKTRLAMKRDHSQMLVACQGIESTSAAIRKVRDEELYPQLIELSQGLMHMWRTMHECHVFQKQVVLQFKSLESWVTQDATSPYHHLATSELEKELSHWYDGFCKLVCTHRDYMTALNGWAHLSLLQIVEVEDLPNKENLCLTANDHSAPLPAPLKSPNPPIISLCEEWQKVLDRLPDMVASEAIKSLVAVVHALVVQQVDELKQKRKVERVSKKLDKKTEGLHMAERKQVEAAVRTSPMPLTSKRLDADGPEDESLSTDSERASDELSASVVAVLTKDPLTEKKALVEALKKKLAIERSKHSKCIEDTRMLTMNNLQTGLPGVFEAMTGFAAVCGQALQALCNHAAHQATTTAATTIEQF